MMRHAVCRARRIQASRLLLEDPCGILALSRLGSLVSMQGLPTLPHVCNDQVRQEYVCAGQFQMHVPTICLRVARAC